MSSARVFYDDGVETPKACLDCRCFFKCEKEDFANCSSGRLKSTDFQLTDSRRLSPDKIPDGFSEVESGEMLRGIG